MQVVNSFKYLGSCFSGDGGVKEDVSVRVDEGMVKYGAMKNVWSCRSVILNVKRGLCTNCDAWVRNMGYRREERIKVDVSEVHFLQSIYVGLQGGVG